MVSGSIYRWMQATRWGVVALCGIVIVLFAVAYWRMPVVEASDVSDVDVSRPDYTWPDPVFIEADAWNVVRQESGAPAETAGPLGQRFRLAGTFFSYPGEDAGEPGGSRRAILDDLESQRQRLVDEGDQLDAIEVVSIYTDRIILRDPNGEEELWLSFDGDASEPDWDALADEELAEHPEARRFEDMPALETSRFGKRIGENRWVFQRDELIRYTDELQDDPERATALFMAMQPEYDEADEVAGFQLDMLGENELYEAAGFQDGDVVRMVNSMPMTSPARAEYFIGEFMHGRISALVFDIERAGEEQKLIHLIR